MKILIIGIRGFIGSHLSAYYYSRGYSVFGCDVKHMPDEMNYFQVDRLSSDYREAVMSTVPEICIYAGGNGSVPISIQDPQLDFQLNTINIHRLLLALKEFAPTCKFLHISSAAVYGNPLQLPIDEGQAPAPLSPYGWHKLLAETICKEFTQLYELPTISVRVFSVFGERLRKQLFWDIYNKSLIGTSIELYGSGNETRDFIYIDDLVQALSTVVEKGQFDGGIVNIGSGTETSIRDAATLFGKALNPEIKLIFNQQTKPGDPKRWQSDIRKLCKFGFNVSISLQEGLSRYAIWLKENELH